MNKDNIQLILRQYNSNFVTHEIVPGVWSINEFSEVVYKMGDQKGALKIEYDEISMKTKLTLTRSGLTFGL